MDEQKFCFALGLAQKAGKLASGDFAVRAALKGGEAKLLILAADAAVNSKKDFLFLAKEYQVPVIEAATRDLLGSSIGKAHRTAVVVLDSGFAAMLQKEVNVSV